MSLIIRLITCSELFEDVTESNIQVLHIHVECKAHICAFLKHIQDRDEEYRLEPLHHKVLADLRQMTWSS